MKIKNLELKKRILEISYKNKLSHLGSCLEAVDIIKEIYDKKDKDENFILSQGHAGLALYVVLEKYLLFFNAEEFLKISGIHPSMDLSDDLELYEKYEDYTPVIDCSTGSLGQGLPIALGMALANRKKNVYCLISDGEAQEGSVWESLTIAKNQKLKNLKIYLNMNGFGGYTVINQSELEKKIKAFGFPVDIRHTDVDYLPFLSVLDGHYKVMSDSDYEIAGEALK